MKRTFEQIIEKWDKTKKKPLVVLGVRQAGKTYIIDKYCKEHYSKYVMINLFKAENFLDIYKQNLDYEIRIQLICQTYKINFKDKDTILFIDEVQKCPKFIQDLKLLCEDGINNIIVAGSLLGITLRDMDEAYPVGKTNLAYLCPMNFKEFLIATGNERFIAIIKNCFIDNTPCLLHNQLMELFHRYMYLGGMPEYLQNYLDNNQDLSTINDSILKEIANDYSNDITKHIKNNKDKIRAKNIYENIATQLMKENPKFMYAKLDGNDRKSDYISALDWLVTSRMVIKCNQITNPESPIRGFVDNDNYKLFLSDTGLLRSKVNVPLVDIILDNDFKYKGVLTENYVATEIFNQFGDVFYWSKRNQGNGSKAEVDFIIQVENQVIPIEVKSSDNKAKSLNIYNELFHPNLMIKIGNFNFGKKDNLRTIPLYATFLLKEVLEEEYKIEIR